MIFNIVENPAINLFLTFIITDIFGNCKPFDAIFVKFMSEFVQNRCVLCSIGKPTWQTIHILRNLLRRIIDAIHVHDVGDFVISGNCVWIQTVLLKINYCDFGNPEIFRQLCLNSRQRFFCKPHRFVLTVCIGICIHLIPTICTFPEVSVVWSEYFGVKRDI